MVAGIFDADPVKYPGTDTNMMLFHYKYLYEATGQRLGAGMYYVEIDDPDQAGEVSNAIDALFENSDAQTHTETEKAFARELHRHGRQPGAAAERHRPRRHLHDPARHRPTP